MRAQAVAKSATSEAAGKVARLEEAVREEALARVGLQQARQVHLRLRCINGSLHASACILLNFVSALTCIDEPGFHAPF